MIKKHMNSNSNRNNITSIILSFCKIVFSLISMKYFIADFGIQEYDYIALAITTSSLLFFLNFSQNLKIRKYLKYEDNEINISKNLIFSACRLVLSVRYVAIYVIVGIMLAIALSNFGLLFFGIVILLNGIGLILAPIENIAAYIKRSWVIRALELLVSTGLVILYLITKFPTLSFLALFIPLPLSRLVYSIFIIFKYSKSFPKSPKFLMLSFSKKNSFSFTSQSRYAFFANFIQSSSYLAINGIILAYLPMGSLTALNIAYRFVNPFATAFAIIAASSNNNRHLSDNISILTMTGSAVLLISLVSSAISQQIFPDADKINFSIFIFAGLHVIISGINQNISSVLYQGGYYLNIFNASLPSLLMLIISFILMYLINIDEPSLFILMSVLSSLLEFFVMCNFRKSPIRIPSRISLKKR